MKKSTLILFLLLAFFFNSCKKGTTTTPEDVTDQTTTLLATEAASPQTASMIQSIKSLASQDLKRLATDLLTSNQKYFLWKDNLKTVSANFTSNQAALITELITFISPQLFNGPPTAAMTAFRDQWLAKAQKIFTSQQIRTIAYQLYANGDHLMINNSGLKTNQYGGDPGDGGGSGACNCNIGSVFSCSDGQYCPSSTDIQFACIASNWKCGFLWGYPCNNLCTALPPE